MAAHAIPIEFKSDRGGYVQLICESILPTVKKQQCARYVDVFCDQGYFSLSETKRIALAAKKLDLDFRIHADELADTGATALAVEVGAHSADHLLKVNNQGIRLLAQSKTVATLLPGTALFLKEAYAPARKLIDSGAIVALASDFNPGTCPTQNLPFIGTLAILQMGMTYAEAIAAITWNAAFSLRKETSFGSLAPGMKGLPVFCEGDHPAALFYRFAGAPLPDPRTI
jgi:imidazolonepropionase